LGLVDLMREVLARKRVPVEEAVALLGARDEEEVAEVVSRIGPAYNLRIEDGYVVYGAPAVAERYTFPLSEQERALEMVAQCGTKRVEWGAWLYHRECNLIMGGVVGPASPPFRLSGVEYARNPAGIIHHHPVEVGPSAPDLVAIGSLALTVDRRCVMMIAYPFEEVAVFVLPERARVEREYHGAYFFETITSGKLGALCRKFKLRKHQAAVLYAMQVLYETGEIDMRTYKLGERDIVIELR